MKLELSHEPEDYALSGPYDFNAKKGHWDESLDKWVWEEESHPEYVDDVETVVVRGKQVPTDLCYTIRCPDVDIMIKQMGLTTSIRVESHVKDERKLFLEARFNTIPSQEALNKAIVKVKLAFDAINGE